jgi:molybdate transport system substrate-binding protein
MRTWLRDLIGWGRSGLPAALGALSLACGPSTSEAPARTELTVFAASSLSDAFADLEREFERAYPNVDVRPSFAGSQVLRLQIEHGAPADVFASADPAHMAALARSGDAAAVEVFAHNTLALIVPLDDPADIGQFDQLDRARRVVVGTPNTPVGAYTRTLLSRAEATTGSEFAAAIRAHVVSEEANVRLVRAKVELGEADAAFVYRTDAVGSDRVRTLAIPPAINVRARYPIATLRRSHHPELAAAFVELVRSAPGQSILERHGFLPATP